MLTKLSDVRLWSFAGYAAMASYVKDLNKRGGVHVAYIFDANQLQLVSISRQDKLGEMI